MTDDTKSSEQATDHSAGHGGEHDQQERSWRTSAERFQRVVEEECLGGARVSVGSIVEAVRDVERQAQDAVHAALPPEVTRHLVNSRKELLMAGRRMIDLAMDRLDAAAERAEEIHRAEQERRAAARAASPAHDTAPENPA